MKKASEYTALGVSVGVHAALLLTLALLKFSLMADGSEVAVETVFSDEREQQEFTQELDLNTEISESLSVVAGATVATAAGGSGAPAVSQTKIEESQSLNEPEIQVNVGQVTMPGANMLGEDLGESEVKGETAAVVEGYGAAMSRLTQELVRHMRNDKVHVVWLFDESGSMKDDQDQIREQFHKVYEELKIAQTQVQEIKKRGQGETLLTSILSFGAGLHTHTAQPTNDIPQIQKAIEQIPVDESGAENLCQSLIAVCEKYGPMAFRSGHKLTIVVVSDESGDDGQAVEEATARLLRFKAPIYIMGREAIFGYPYARQRWVDPATKLDFWIRVNRGPETAFPEALQYDGLHERWDAFSSGFGPYEMVRLSRESGGIYFMLPGDEENLVGAGANLNRKFEFLAMKEYQPILESRRDYEKERGQSKFRSTLWEIINVLNPHQDEQLKVRELWYPLEPEKFQPEGLSNASKALRAFGLLNEAIKRLESVQPLRAKEDSQRWRAAFDLTYAQCLAYRVRLFQFMLAVDSHIKNKPKPTKEISNKWNAKRTQKMLEPDEQQIKVTKVDMAELNKQLDRAKQQFQYVKQQHPGTPWEQRANWELGNGFGFTFVEDFRDPRYEDPRSNIKVPKF